MFLLNTTQPLTVLLLLAATVLLIFLGKEIKKPIIPAIALTVFLLILLMHSVQLCMPSYEEYYATIRYCIAFELVMVFITFFSYLWIDDVASKFYNKKSIDNSLDWFWKQV
ncbi:MAG: hypothetical protein ACI4VP_03965 [Clostridia bacterium]